MIGWNACFPSLVHIELQRVVTKALKTLYQILLQNFGSWVLSRQVLLASDISAITSKGKEKI